MESTPMTAIAPVSFSAPDANLSNAVPSTVNPAESIGNTLFSAPAPSRIAIIPLSATPAESRDPHLTRLKIAQAAASLIMPPERVLMTQAACKPLPDILASRATAAIISPSPIATFAKLTRASLPSAA